MDSEGYLPLFETKQARGRVIYRIFALSVFVGICLIWFYRVNHIPIEGKYGKLGWLALFAAEVWFGFYWILTQAPRWSPVYRTTFKDRLSERYDKKLPGVDVFVCTADPIIEPPMLVVNTILSVMAYDYPTEKLSVYLSDDAASQLTFYAMMEASCFARHWLPFCKNFNIEPRSPAAYFSSMPKVHDSKLAQNLAAIKKLYNEMEDRITRATELGKILDEECSKHIGFSQWEKYNSRGEHDTILQLIIDKRDSKAVDIEGCILPGLVYLAREKRPQHPHNFKAGAMNALIRVSSKISNGPIILNVDCDMYSNDSQSVRDALCFFMDEEKGHEFAYVQFPQNFENTTKNDLYGSTMRVISELEFHGLDAYEGPMYVGTGCFHRRDALSGKKFGKGSKIKWEACDTRKKEERACATEEELKALASCISEENSQWGKQMGLRYGCPVEDVITGLAIQCEGWKSAYYNPVNKAFLGVAPTTLPQVLLQHKRWSEGDFQILLSKYSPLSNGYGKISTILKMGYCSYCLWAPSCLATICYSVIPSLYLLSHISLFPEISSPWFIPFAYVICAKYLYSLLEFLWSGGTVTGWWHEQRIWLYKRTSSYLFAFIDTLLKLLGIANSAFVITTKVADEDVSERFEKEIIEFGISSPMLTVLATLALLYLSCLLGAVTKAALIEGATRIYETCTLQILLCGLLVLINLPLYEGMFLRMDKGKIPSSTTVQAILSIMIICTCFIYLC